MATSYGKIQLQADVKNANAGLEALKKRSDDLKDSIAATKAQMETLDESSGAWADLNNKLRDTEKALKQVETIYKSNMRGLSAFEEVLKSGMENASIATLKSSITYAKQRLANTPQEDVELRASFRSFITESEAQVNIMMKGYEEVIANLHDVTKVSDHALDGFIADMHKLNEEGNVLDEFAQKYRDNEKAALEERRRRQGVKLTDTIGSLEAMDRHSEEEIKAAIQLATQLRSTEKAGSEEFKTLTSQILVAEEYLKQYSLTEVRAAAQREALMNRMKTQMGEISSLSNSAITESVKFWNAQRDGAAKGSEAYNTAVANLNKLREEEKKRAKEAAAQRLEEMDKDATAVMGDLSGSSVKEIEDTIRNLELLRDAQSRSSDKWEEYDNQIKKARAHLQEWNDLSKSLAMEERMGRLGEISKDSLKEVIRYYQAQIDGAERSDTALDEYIEKLRLAKREEEARAKDEERRRAEEDERAARGVMDRMDFASQEEIEGAIKAYERLSKTVIYGGDEWKDYADGIRRAKDYLDSFATDPKWEKMQGQLDRGDLSSSALKAQEDYWRHMADSAGLAADKVALARANLERVKVAMDDNLFDAAYNIMDEMDNQSNHQGILGEYANKTGEEWKEAAKILEQYRETLHKVDDADEIEEVTQRINALKEKTEKAKEETMSYDQALQHAQEVADGTFDGTIEDLEKVKKALIEHKRTLKMGSENSGIETTEKQIRAVDVALKTATMSSEEFKKTMEDPSVVNDVDLLKAALKRAEYQMRTLVEAGDDGKKEFEDLSKNTKKVRERLDELESSGKTVTSAFGKAIDRLKTYVGVYMGFQAVWGKITGSFDDALELSDRMGEVGKTTQLTADEVANLQRRFAQIDTRTPQEELANLAAAAGQLGLKSTEDIYGFVEAANKISVALPEMGREGITQLMKIAQVSGDIDRNGGDIQESLERVGSTIDKLRASSASAAPHITDFVARIGGVGATSNMTMAEMAGLGSTVDALGMRIEMTATALSRMIPAIRDNAFGVAQAIGVTEKTLKDLFAQGRSMEAMVLIFQKLRESSVGKTEEEAAASVEAILGKNAALKEVMRELNQQGARAGIVFSALSKNVDELERQLSIARNAYAENIAITQEYDRMNETAAARLERLKHQLEEAIVNPSTVKFLEIIYKSLHWIVNLWRENAVLINATLVLITGLARGWSDKLGQMLASVRKLKLGISSLGVALKNIGPMLILSGLTAAATWLYEWLTGVEKVDKAMASLEDRISEALALVDNSFKAQEKQVQTLDELSEGTEKLREKVKTLREEVNSGRDAITKKTLSEDEAIKKEAELRSAEQELEAAESDLGKARDRNRSLIDEINQKYSKYLGYMLTEATNAKSVASAHKLISEALREEILLKEKNAVMEGIREGNKEERQEANESARKVVSKRTPEERALISSIFNDVMAEVQGYDVTKGSFTLGFKTNEKSVIRAIETEFIKRLREAGIQSSNFGTEFMQDALGNGFLNVIKVRLKEMEDIAKQEADIDAEIETQHKKTTAAALKNYQQLEANVKGMNLEGLSDSDLNKAIRELGENLRGMSEQLNKYSDLRGKTSAKGAAGTDALSLMDFYLPNLSADNRRRLDTQLKSLLPTAGNASGAGGGTTPTSPYGGFDRVKDGYESWDANALVARRKEMLERARALASGADVQAVLSEDARFIDATTREALDTTEKAINWYYTESEKIRKALEGKHMTSTGNWMVQGKTGKRKMEREMKKEMTAALAALDAYYNAEEATIKERRTTEVITENEMNRQLRENESEHLMTRVQLRRMFLGEMDRLSNDEVDAIYDIINTEDDTEEGIRIKFIHLQTMIQTLGKSFRDDIRRSLTEDLSKEQDLYLKHQKKIRKILLDGDYIAKANEKMANELDELNLIFAEDEEVMAKSDAERNRRLAILRAISRDSYKIEVNGLRDRLAAHQEFNGVLAGMDDETLEVMLQKLREYHVEMNEAIKKSAKTLEETAQLRWDDPRKTLFNMEDPSDRSKWSKEVLEARERMAQNGIDTARRMEETGWWGGQDITDDKELELYRLRMEASVAWMEQLEREMALAEQKAKMDVTYHEARLAELKAQGAYAGDISEEEANLEAARQRLNDMEMTRMQVTQDAQSDFQSAMSDLFNKELEDANRTTEKMATFYGSLETFAENFAQNIYGSKEDRQAAGKQLLIDVMKQGKDLLQQWLVQLATKKWIDEAEVAANKAKNIRMMIDNATMAGTELTIEGQKVSTTVALETVEATAKEAAKKGFIGLAVGAAIGVALNALLGLAMGKLNQSKAEIQSVAPSAGSMQTDMLTYATGNVDEVLEGRGREGQSYDVKGKNGKSYRAQYVGSKMKTGVYHGTHFGIFSEEQPELIVDGKTTQRLMLDYPHVLDVIETLSRGGRPKDGTDGMAVYASGNVAGIAGSAQGGGNSDAMRQELANLRGVVGQLSQVLRDGIKAKADISILGEGGLDEEWEKAQRFKKRNGKG